MLKFTTQSGQCAPVCPGDRLEIVEMVWRGKRAVEMEIKKFRFTTEILFFVLIERKVIKYCWVTVPNSRYQS